MCALVSGVQERLRERLRCFRCSIWTPDIQPLYAQLLRNCLHRLRTRFWQQQQVNCVFSPSRAEELGREF